MIVIERVVELWNIKTFADQYVMVVTLGSPVREVERTNPAATLEQALHNPTKVDFTLRHEMGSVPQFKRRYRLVLEEIEE